MTSRLIATPGHTPGHVSVRIESAGAVAYISGDAVHHPVQIGDPEIAALPDVDPVSARASREQLLRRAADERALLLGSHFAAPSGGFVESGRWRPDVATVGRARGSTMTETQHLLPEGFDFTDPALIGERIPHEEFALLRKTEPIWWNAQPFGVSGYPDEGYWVVTEAR